MEDTSIRISRATHAKLVAYAAHLTLKRKQKVTLARAVELLVEAQMT